MLNLSANFAQNYDRIHHIGEGTYGTVYRCYVKGSTDVVAIKKFKESDEGDSQVRTSPNLGPTFTTFQIQ